VYVVQEQNLCKEGYQENFEIPDCSPRAALSSYNASERGTGGVSVKEGPPGDLSDLRLQPKSSPILLFITHGSVLQKRNQIKEIHQESFELSGYQRTGILSLLMTLIIWYRSGISSRRSTRRPSGSRICQRAAIQLLLMTQIIVVQERNQFKKVHQETFGKSGCRRIVPGQYLATDPKGRACMIAAVEKQKFVYVLNR